jgi:hypothetical protein
MPLNIESFCSDLQRLKIAVPGSEDLRSVYELEGDNLSRAATEVRMGNKRAADYLRGIFWTITPQCKSLLAQQRMMIPPLKVLVEIGKREGTQFARRLKQWADSGETGDCEDSRYIRLTCAEFLRNHTTQNAHPNRQQPGRGSDLALSNESLNSSPQATNPARREPPPQQRPDQTRAHIDVPSQHQDSGNASGEDAQNSEPNYLAYRIYAGKAAACFSADSTRSGNATVRIEAAEGNQRQYDWGSKIAIQLSAREMPLVLAALMQWIPSFEGKGHGLANEKWFRLENQPGKVYLSVNAKGKAPRGIPIPAGDAYSLCTLLMRQMLKNDPFLSSEALLTIVRKQAEMVNAMASAQDRQAADQQRNREYAN